MRSAAVRIVSSMFLLLIYNSTLIAQQFAELPALPDPHGFAGPFVGVADNQLIVAGGANFPEKPLWETGKVWYRSIYVLDKPTGSWRRAAETLPTETAYGLSFNLNRHSHPIARDIPQGVLCLGGGNATEHFSSCFVITLQSGRIKIQSLPDLPDPIAFTTGVLANGVVYVVGGTHATASTQPAEIFWKLDLTVKRKKVQWEKLPIWPGPPRMLAVAGCNQHSLFLFSGTDLVLQSDKTVARKYLVDAYEYRFQSGQWRRIADLPRATVAAPTPAIRRGDNQWIISGDDGQNALRTNELKDNHPGFPPGILQYSPDKNTWSVVGEFPKTPGSDPAEDPHAGIWPPVTTNVTHWYGKAVIASGEVRPRVRSRRVFQLDD